MFSLILHRHLRHYYINVVATTIVLPHFQSSIFVQYFNGDTFNESRVDNNEDPTWNHWTVVGRNLYMLQMMCLDVELENCI